jgi:ATP-dependent Clp protease ATP-binding subunit ClpC
VCMTSNLGAQDFGSGPFGLARGTSGGDTHARSHFTDALRDFLRPELFNRIDRVVPFLPLGPETIGRIAQREIELIARRDGVLRRNLRLEVSPAAVEHLARAGYDPVYGARPLKRRVEQDLLTPLAEATNQYAPATPLEARVDVSGGGLAVEVWAAKCEQATGQDSSVAELVHRASAVRRRAQAVVASPAYLALQNELFTLDRLIKRKDAHAGRRFVDPAQRERIKRLEAIDEGLRALRRDVEAAEDAILLNLYEGAPLPDSSQQADGRLALSEVRADEFLLHLLSLAYPHPHAITLGLFGGSAGALFGLAHAYREALLAGRSEGRTGIELPAAGVAVSYYTRLGKATLQRTTVSAEDVATFFAETSPGVLGIVLAGTGSFARARFEGEGGLHVLQQDRDVNPQPVWVDTSTESSADYRPPKDVEFRVALAGRRRRTYTLERREADDAATGQTYRWSGKGMSEAVVAAAAEQLRRRAEAILAT